MSNTRVSIPNSTGNARFWAPIEGGRYYSEDVTVRDFDVPTETVGDLVNMEGWSKVQLSIAGSGDPGGAELLRVEYGASDGATSDAVVGLGQLKIELSEVQTAQLQETGETRFFVSLDAVNAQGNLISIQGGSLILDPRPVSA